MPWLLAWAALALAACSHASPAGVDSRMVNFEHQPFAVVRIDLARAPLALYWRDPDSHQPYANIESLQRWGAERGQELVFAANAGIYDRAHAPLGLYVENGKTLVPLNTAHGNPAHGNFSLLPNGVFSIDTGGQAHVQTTQAWQAGHAPPQWATQSGPMLVIDGHINPHFKADSTSVRWRSGVCVNAKGTVLFAISTMPVNFHTFARLFRDQLGCDNALYLDGTLSQIYVQGQRYGPPAFMVGPWAGIFAVFKPRPGSK